MDYAITLKDLFFILLGIGILVLVVYLIMFFKNLVITLKATNEVLKDAKTITTVAAERTQDVDNVISNVQESVENLTKNIRGNKSAIGFIGSAINFLTSLKGFLSKKKSAGNSEKRGNN